MPGRFSRPSLRESVFLMSAFSLKYCVVRVASSLVASEACSLLRRTLLLGPRSRTVIRSRRCIVDSLDDFLPSIGLHVLQTLFSYPPCAPPCCGLYSTFGWQIIVLMSCPATIPGSIRQLRWRFSSLAFRAFGTGRHGLAAPPFPINALYPNDKCLT